MDSFKVNSERYVLLRLPVIVLSAAPSINGKRRINCELETPAQAEPAGLLVARLYPSRFHSPPIRQTLYGGTCNG